MHMPATQERWTPTAVRALPDDGKRYELIGGELLVTPAPRSLHQAVVTELLVRLREYVRREGVGVVLPSPADLELEPETIVQPDVFVIPFGRDRTLPEWSEVKELLLACEVISPATARYDRVTKRRFFARNAVAEYWVLDPDGEFIERTIRGDEKVEIAAERLIWDPPGARESFTLDVVELFRSARGA